jgi:UDP-glucose 6-dehydrogenase
MKISVVGREYAGPVTGHCFAGFWHLVTISEIDPEKIMANNDGLSPIYGHGMERPIAWIKSRQHCPARPASAISDEYFRYLVTAT